MKPVLATGLLACALGLALSAPAGAQDAAALFRDALGAPQPYTNTPKPWPLKHLIKDDTLVIGTTGAAPPRTFVDPKTGELTGSYVDLFKKIGADLGLKVQFVQIEWAGILPGLAANRFDLACDGASWTKERLGSDQFLMTAPTAINASVGIALKSSGIKTFDEIGKKVIGGVRGEVYYEDAKTLVPGAGFTEFPGLQESLLGLANGQADVVVTNLANALNILQTAPNKDDLTMVGPALEVFPQSLCVNPREPDLLVAVNTLLGNYRADGSLSKLVGSYATSTAEVDLLDRIGY